MTAVSLTAGSARAGAAVETDLAGYRVLAAKPVRINAQTPLVLLWPGLGPPNSPAALASCLPPLVEALCLYAPLPFAPGAPGGGPEALLARQQDDYAGALLIPLLDRAAGALDAITAAATKRYGLESDRGVHLFGFSMGGAAVLGTLTRSRTSIRSVVALNAPLSVRAAVSAYERKLGTVYRAKRPDIFGAYDLAAEAETIKARRPQLQVHIVQGEADDQFGVREAQRVREAFRAVGHAAIELTVLGQGGHNALATHAPTQAEVGRLLTAAVLKL